METYFSIAQSRGEPEQYISMRVTRATPRLARTVAALLDSSPAYVVERLLRVEFERVMKLTRESIEGEPVEALAD